MNLVFSISRTSRYKTLSIISLSIGLFSYLLITIRWRHGTNVWESFYVFPVGLGFGMILSTQFVGLTASAPKAQSTTAVSVYYLSQQIGSIIGIATSAALLRYVFSHTLLHQLKDCDDRDAVSIHTSQHYSIRALSTPEWRTSVQRTMQSTQALGLTVPKTLLAFTDNPRDP